MSKNLLFRGLFLNFYRRFNWKYPYPKELQPSPPEKETINPENLVKIQNPMSANDKFNQEYINRNPRNLEQMLLEVKPNGYPIDAPNRVFWNKLHFERSAKHTSAKVYHNSGRKIASASTKEWAIKKHLKSGIDNDAVACIARVLARRCLQSGILFVSTEFAPREFRTTKVQLLLKTLQEGGLKTKELSAILAKDERYL
ncbi:large ribosomal subunit protein uL18m [Parasteatoda tepidariorum]|uniref:large ribosomal subunit protein uL18m n=1 Tax=Parasteatoda tepidariorum TaxID=114398 RepID=UPI000A2C0ADF|nr:39S ribosomal protein L18, mitochondrial [Parasteatoda tepidariorum]